MYTSELIWLYPSLKVSNAYYEQKLTLNKIVITAALGEFYSNFEFMIHLFCEIVTLLSNLSTTIMSNESTLDKDSYAPYLRLIYSE